MGQSSKHVERAQWIFTAIIVLRGAQLFPLAAKTECIVELIMLDYFAVYVTTWSRRVAHIFYAD
jgi:hypothetical protein